MRYKKILLLVSSFLVYNVSVLGLNPQYLLDSPYVNVLDVEIIHNVKVDGEWGMRIDVDFRAFNLKNTTCKIRAYFYLSSREWLKDFNTRYATTDHQVSTYKTFRPGYTDASYSNYSLYIPYSELHINKGESYNLELVVAAKYGTTSLGWSKYIPFSVRL